MLDVTEKTGNFVFCLESFPEDMGRALKKIGEAFRLSPVTGLFCFDIVEHFLDVGYVVIFAVTFVHLAVFDKRVDIFLGSDADVCGFCMRRRFCMDIGSAILKGAIPCNTGKRGKNCDWRNSSDDCGLVFSSCEGMGWPSSS